MDYRPGTDIFSLDVDCIINPVNCQVHKLADRGRRQEGLAGAFEKRYPEIQPALVKACREGLMKPGGVQLMRVDRATGKRSKEGDLLIANVATKDYWADPSKMEWVDAGLKKLSKALDERGVKSVAVPMLGAGFGKLAWKDVRERVETHFRPLSEKGMNVVVLGEGPVKSRDREAAPSQPPAVEAPAPAAMPSYDKSRFYYAGIGARDTPLEVLPKMTAVAEKLAARGWVLRSGGAARADTAFEQGADKAGGAKEIYLPWDGFDPERNGKKRFADGKSVFAEVDHRHEAVARKYHPAFDKLSSGPRALMSRNSSQMLGRDLATPSGAVLCYTKDGKTVGGTGQALRMAEDMGVPVVNFGDPQLRGMSVASIVNIAVAVGEERKPIGMAMKAERLRARREADQER